MANKIVQRAHELLGVQWVHQGRNPEVGFDCAGLVIEAMLAAGINIDATSNYGRLEESKYINRYIEKYFSKVDSMQPGDVLLMRWRRVPNHVGIYIGNNDMIHCYEGSGVVVQQLINFWADRIVGVYRINLGV